MRKLIIDRLDELGLNMAEASIKIGKNHAYLQQFLKRGIPVKLKEDERLALAQLLGVPESELRGTSPKLAKRDYSKQNERNPLVPPPQKKSDGDRNSLDKLIVTSATYGERDLPVFGTAQGGTGGSLIMSNEAVDWVMRPAPLLRVRDGYGMIVSGDSMYPKIESGSTALVNPHLPPRAGDTCVFRRHMDDGTVLAVIKLLRRYTDDAWLVHQFNPKKDFSLKRSEWQVCHVVIGSYFWR